MMTETTTWWGRIKRCSGTEADRRNVYGFGAWILAWGASYMAATWLLRGDHDLGAVAWVVAVAPDLVALGALLAYLRFLRETDELTRKIQLDGIALGFGAGLVFAVSYQLLERAGAPQVGIGQVGTVLMVAWAAGQILGVLRYR